MKYKEYTLKVLTTPEAMFTTYECAKILNPNMSYDDYKVTIKYNCSVMNYKQVAMVVDEVPVAMVAMHDTCLMKHAPAKALILSNIATLPEYRGQVTKVLLSYVKGMAMAEGYGNIDIKSSKQNLAAEKSYTKAGFSNGESYAWRIYLAKDVTPKAPDGETKWQKRITEEKQPETMRAKL